MHKLPAFLIAAFVLMALCGVPGAHAASRDYIPPAKIDRPHQGGPLQYGCKTEDCVMIEGVRRMHSEAPADVAEQHVARAAAYAAQVTAPSFIPADQRYGMITDTQDILQMAAHKSVIILSLTLHTYTADNGALFCGTAIVDNSRRSRFVVALHPDKAQSGYNVDANADVWMRAGCDGEGLVLQ